MRWRGGGGVDKEKDSYYRAGCTDTLFSPSSLQRAPGWERVRINQHSTRYFETVSPTQLTGILLSLGNSNGITDEISGHVGVKQPSAPNGHTLELRDLLNYQC